MQPILSNRWGFTLISTIISLTAIGLLAFATLIWQLPSVNTLKDSHLQAPLRIFTKQGDLIAEFGEKQRLPVSLKDIPNRLIQAVLSTEDQRFYQHNGVDMISLMRAAHSLILTGEKRQGASTITMQVARNFFLSRHKTFLRKFREILLAIKLEQYLNKNEILELYLNKIFFGMRAYGVKAAARNYYGKQLDELTLAETAMIAGLPQAPSSNNPITNPTKAVKRRNHVLRKCMSKKINLTAYKIATAAPVTAKKHSAQIKINAPYVAEMARTTAISLFGKDYAYNEGLSIYTTIDSNKQSSANNAIFNGLRAYDKRHGFRQPTINLLSKLDNTDLNQWTQYLKDLPAINDLLPAAIIDIDNNIVKALLNNGQIVSINPQNAMWALKNHRIKPRQFNEILNKGDLIYVTKIKDNWYLEQLPQVQGAIVSINSSTGFIDSLVGGFSYKLSHFNRAMQANRQSGSCFKPFIFSAALDFGITPATIFNDAPIVLPSTGEDLLWRPENSDHQFKGPTSLRSALIHSKNLVSIRILREIGLDYASSYIKRFGFNEQPQSLSLVLGAGSVTPIEINAAYASFANTGFKVEPILINSIINQSGQIIYNSNIKLAKRILSEETAFLMADMLKDVIEHGSGRRAKVLKRNDIAGKTGTTNNKIDAWFIGFTPQVVTTVWVGFDQLKPLHEYASKAALPIWIDYMQHTLKNQKQQWLKLPDDIIQVKIDPLTGKQSNLASAKFEYFKSSKLPDKTNLNNENNNIDLDNLY